MTYFSDNSIGEDERRNNAFTLLCAVREAVTIAKRAQQHIPYKKTLTLINELNPEAYKDINDLITKTNESEIVKYYKQKASLLSKEKGKEVKPEDLIETDLNEERRLLLVSNDADLIKRKILELEVALEHFKPDDISENSILNSDFSLTSRHKFFEKKIYESAKIKDYELSGNRLLRLKLLHPDKAERIIGTDLVYEKFDLETEQVRFMHLQYKTWNTNTLYFSQGNLIEQIEKMDKNLCQSGYCNSETGTNHSNEYRFPHCSAFLRPTSFLTKPDSTLISSGLHIPICAIRKIQKTDNKISNRNTRGTSIGHKIFEELFIENFIGSRAIAISELEEFYVDRGVASDLGRIRVHAQEVKLKKNTQ
ncbi:MAG TPA: hypothetical protein VIM75_21565 [Ohtaekwangia sp.]|uniref:hypothetical protein n=1 Tax=Ohtaekwangia sp. TaxID=2066019 RepID=UPI002F933060